MTASQATPRPRLLLLDDDPLFAKKLERYASRYGIELHAVGTIEAFLNVASAYDAAIVDYDLSAAANGVEVADYVQRAARGLPIVLTSSDERASSGDEPWPACVRAFIRKSDGGESLLAAAVATRRGTQAASWQDFARRLPVAFLNEAKQRDWRPRTTKIAL